MGSADQHASTVVQVGWQRVSCVQVRARVHGNSFMFYVTGTRSMYHVRNDVKRKKPNSFACKA